MLKHIKTPKDRFENLLDYPFSGNYMEVGEELAQLLVEFYKGNS